jgi:hypothetical protein
MDVEKLILMHRRDAAAKARRQALLDAADDFEAGATPDDIRSNAERIEPCSPPPD